MARLLTKMARRRDREMLDVLGREQRFLMGGNAGGLIASLSLAGAIIGTSGADSAALPWQLFVVVVTFFVGLSCVGIMVYAERHALESRLVHDNLDDLEKEFEFGPIPEHLVKQHLTRMPHQRWIEAAGVARSISWLTLTGGSIIGLVVLFGFTRG